MSVLVIDADALRALVREEVRLALEPVLAAVARLGATQTAGDGDALMTREEVAALLQVNTRDLRRLVLEGAFPAPIKVGGRRLRWRKKSVTRWLDAAERSRLHVRPVGNQTADRTEAEG